MAINILSETSPRISFSNDFCQADVEPIDHCKSRNSELSILENSDFDFCVSSSSFEHESSSSAAELFSNGIILPIKIQERTDPPRSVASLPPLPSPGNESLKKESSKGISVSSSESQEKLQSSKSFWPFKRSTSLNCDNVHRRSLMCSLPLLSRSNSTGSVSNSKRTTASKQNSQKQPSMAKSSSSSSSSSSASSYTNFYTYPVSQKPQLKKNFGGSYGNGVWISPVINVPPANLFGLFRNGKDKKSKK